MTKFIEKEKTKEGYYNSVNDISKSACTVEDCKDNDKGVCNNVLPKTSLLCFKGESLYDAAKDFKEALLKDKTKKNIEILEDYFNCKGFNLVSQKLKLEFFIKAMEEKQVLLLFEYIYEGESDSFCKNICEELKARLEIEKTK